MLQRWSMVRGALPTLLLAAVAGCGVPIGSPPNAFLTYTDAFGTSAGGDDDDNGGGGGEPVPESEFRADMSLTLANVSAVSELNVSFMAWVNVSSIRSAEQVDALLNAGYVQLTREERIGVAFTLPPGTFVLDGGARAGARILRLPPGAAAEGGGILATTPEEQRFTIKTPDVLLVFSEPPASCDSVGFYFTQQGFPIDLFPGTEGEQGADTEVGGNAVGDGGRKTLAQIDVYQCEPLEPGLFLKTGGGSLARNEYFEGQSVRFDFFPVSDAQGLAAFVTVGP